MDAPGPAVVAASESEYDSQEETEYYDEEEEQEIQAEVTQALSASKEKMIQIDKIEAVDNPAAGHNPI